MRFTPLKLILAKALLSPHLKKACKIYNGAGVLGSIIGATAGAVIAVEKNNDENRYSSTLQDFLVNNGRILLYSGCGSVAGGCFGKGVVILSPILIPVGIVYFICK
jgi:hypothetical protein